MKPIFETVKCNICKSDDYELISQKGQFGFETNVVICKNCGLGYLNPRWDKDSYMNFYENEYDDYYRPTVFNASSSSKDLNPILERIQNSTAKIESSQIKSTLDIGSGEGKNLAGLRDVFPESELFAIEPSLKSQELLQEFGITVIGSDIDSDWHKDFQGKFDLIIMRHVLEHFMDPVDAMQKVRGILSKVGIAYIAVPNNLNPTALLESKWFRVVHTYYFNKYSLSNLMKICGLEIIDLVEGDQHNKGEVYLIVRASENRLEVRFSNDHFNEQRKVFKSKLKRDKNPFLRAFNKIERKLK